MRSRRAIAELSPPDRTQVLDRDRSLDRAPAFHTAPRLLARDGRDALVRVAHDDRLRLRVEQRLAPGRRGCARDAR
jgi:hypothetical protein